MPADPSVETHPLLFAVVNQHVDYYQESQERISKAYILADLQKDSQFGAMLEECGLNPEHDNAMRAFRRVYWYVVRLYMNPKTGWYARSTGASASFFHEDWGTPEELRDALNIRIRDREKDEAALKRLYGITETRCGQLGWVFDPQFDEAGVLVHVEAWKR